MDQVDVEITSPAITAQYGTLKPGAILRTDLAFAKHLVEDCHAAKYVVAKPALKAPAAKPATKVPVAKPATKVPVAKPATKVPVAKPATKVPVAKPATKVPVAKVKKASVRGADVCTDPPAGGASDAPS